MPRLTIITTNLNDAAGLQNTFDSVFSQDTRDFEYFVIDGASTDGSEKLIQANADKLTYWVSEADKGVYDAMNKGIQKASGEYIMFLNSGDYLLHNKVLTSAIKSTDGRQADVYYGNIQLNENGKIYSLKYPPVLTLDFWEEATINHQASLIKSSLFKEIGLYDMKYSIAADYAFFLKCFFYGKEFKYVNEDWVHFQLTGLSSLNRDVYKLQMKTAWRDMIPAYVDNLYGEHKAHSILMQHRIMRLAKKANNAYKKIKNVFKK